VEPSYWKNKKPYHFTVCELKCGEITREALEQVQRYRFDLVNVWIQQLGYFHWTDDEKQRLGLHLHDGYQFIRASLVGHHISENLMRACVASKIQVMTYDYDTETDTYSVGIRQNSIYGQKHKPHRDKQRSIVEGAFYNAIAQLRDEDVAAQGDTQ
jgi:hypothetical protein